MRVQVVIGLALALACATGTNLGGLWKYKGACATSAVDYRRPVKSATTLFRSKWFAIGWFVAVLGWALHVGALALAPLSLAQAVISGGLVMLGVFAERYFGFKLERRQWFGLALVSIAMVVLAVTSHSEGNHAGYAAGTLAAFEAVIGVLGVALVLSSRLPPVRERYSVALGTAAGLLFGLADVSIKAVTGSSGGALAIVSPWTLTAIAAGVVAFYTSARSLQLGDAVAVIAATAAAANVIGIVAGVVIFGDPIGPGTLIIAGRLVAFVLVVLAVAMMPAPTRAQRAMGDSDDDSARVRREQSEDSWAERPAANEVTV